MIKGIPSLLCELTDKERDQLVIHENVFSGKKLRFYNRYMSNAFLTLIHNDYVSVIINKRLDANKLVLDIGCGSGNVGKKIINSGAHLISMDIALNAVSEARNALGNSGKDFIQSSVLRIPIEDSAVDVIIGHFILHHIDDIKKAVSEIRRVLTPDGYMVFVEPTERLTWLELWLDFFKIIHPKGPRKSIFTKVRMSMVCY
ncbi:MAG: class I SAM-dependent methyltransferase [Candidatus Omnitrophica bacterium]|nr:class I SAM-dependent methyltransferase [Candidatus Omnitrophota bacterium]